MSASSAGGTTMRAGWGTYAAVLVVTLVSIFPLYYTIVMASHTNAEMAAKTPPLLPNASFFGNVKKALELAPLNHGLVNSLIVSGSSPSAPSRSARSPGSPSPSSASAEPRSCSVSASPR